jgi:CRISPR-associated protein Csb2
MPWEKKGPLDRTLVFDTFVSINRHDPLYVGWPAVDLPAEDQQVFSRLLDNLSSLGRAESWVHAELWAKSIDLDLGEAGKDDPNPIPVLCPDPRSAFSDEHYPTHDPKKLANGKVNPADFLFDCPRWHLCLDTETIHAERWPTVPGSKWVNYGRPRESDNGSKVQRPTLWAKTPVTVVRFLIDGPVLPRTIDTLPFAEAVRAATLSKLSSPTLSGHAADGLPLNHTHAFYLPTAEDDDPHHLTHITLYAKAGFTDDEIRALNSLRHLTWPRGDKSRDYQLRIVGIGQPKDFTARIFAASDVWISSTPFVSHRFLKRGQTIEQSAADLIETLEVGQIVSIESDSPPPFAIPARTFKRFRSRREDDGQHRPFARLRMRFAGAVSGPLSLGYGAHFGLGLFTPAINHE